ncbi:hypothetical protein [Draconibacterium halophilum]|uniref:Uncharacterized protein n=1 Tax=Draconibacterium halophilum TaxID=2706887 RepID=A0A6C0RFI1_9BACT|nr:hypothetical protein [Draconibacterium halophilum]QIA08810.1 hypothetical protein G0Q07_14255 [Draconibacterium halophilum]QIA08827.1 hypothetical protein G0Q07_14350 [Draconibacterium halophilum]
MDKKITKIIKERFANNEFDVKSNLTFYKQNKAEFYEMVRRGIITKNVGGKIYLIEKPKPFIKKHAKWIITTVIALVVAITPFVIKKCDTDSPANKQKDITQSSYQEQNKIESEKNYQNLNQVDSIRYQKTDSASVP